MNNSLSSKSSVMSSSSVVESSSSVRATSAHSSSASSAVAKKAEPASVAPLRERTSTKDVNAQTRDLKIVEKNGDVITAALVKPSLQFAEEVRDAHYEMTQEDGSPRMLVTTPRYQKKMFKMFRNLEINGKPTSGMSFGFGNKHIEAFEWMMRKADSFLADKFNAA